jgi:hypothetical protein
VNAINRLEKEENVSRTEKGRRKRKKNNTLNGSNVNWAK